MSGLVDLRPVLVDDRGLVLAELLADRVHLLAEEELPLLLLHPRVDVLADALADLHQREPLALEGERELEPLGDVDRLEQLHLLLEGEVGAVAGRVGERARLGDRADERLDAPVVAAQLEDLVDDGAVLDLELADHVAGRGHVGVLLDLDQQPTLDVGLGGAGDAAVQPLERDGGAAAGKSHAVGDDGDRADGGVRAVALRDEQHALLVADLDGQRDVHVREDDDVVEGDEQQLAHGGFTLLGLGDLWQRRMRYQLQKGYR